MISQEQTNAAINQWSKWLLLVAGIVDISCSLYILWCMIVANFISILSCTENAASIYVYWLVLFNYQLLNKEYLTALFKPCHFVCYRLISEHFGENRVTLWLTAVKLRCIKLCAFFSGPFCSYWPVCWPIRFYQYIAYKVLITSRVAVVRRLVLISVVLWMFVACLKQCERDARVKLPLKAQIVKPAQRIPRYELLLKVS